MHASERRNLGSSCNNVYFMDIENIKKGNNTKVCISFLGFLKNKVFDHGPPAVCPGRVTVSTLRDLGPSFVLWHLSHTSL